MSLLGNIIWFVLGGWWNFLLFALLGGIFCITIIGIPIGKALFQYAKLMALPFGKVIMKETDIKGKENVSVVRRLGGTIANIIWFPIGAIGFLLSIAEIIACAITIIGIPVAIVIARSCTFLLWPVGAKVVTQEQAETIRIERNMMKVVGASVAVSTNMMAQQMATVNKEEPKVTPTKKVAKEIPEQEEEVEQSQSSIQFTQTLENLKTGGTQVLENIKVTSDKAMTTIVQNSQEGMTALKNRQQQMSEQVLAQESAITLSEVLAQIEVKLYQNKVMAWIMPFLEYITLAIGALFIVVSIIFSSILFDSISIGIGILIGIQMMAPLLWLVAILEMIKQNHIIVSVILGVQIGVHITTNIWLAGSNVFLLSSWIELIVLIGIMVWYIFTFVRKGDLTSVKLVLPNQVMQRTKNVKKKEDVNVSSKKYFCSQCGEPYDEQTSFCSKCGTKLN